MVFCLILGDEIFRTCRPNRCEHGYVQGRDASQPSFDRDYWEDLWARTLVTHADVVASKPPSAYLTDELADLDPGRALDAGCGHGAETLWLAGHGWRVTALDFSASALDHGRDTAGKLGAELARRIDWMEADLGRWSPEPAAYDLILCLYVHVAGDVEELVRRMASGVAPGGTLFMAGQRPIDPATGQPSAAAAQTQVSVEQAMAALGGGEWEIVIAEERVRTQGPSGADAVIRARRR
jgi:2-polyprenyl-3-methyl-5-hydroxy-6-metoxy-1,4-benzoquinol methylase